MSEILMRKLDRADKRENQRRTRESLISEAGDGRNPLTI
jgi:hypothetical protein